MFIFKDLPLAQRFMLISFFVLVSIVLLVGTIVSGQIEVAIVERTGALTTFFLDSLLTHHLAGIRQGLPLDDEMKREISHIFESTSFSEQMVAYKLWSPDGRILYSPDNSLIGEHFDNDDLTFAVETGRAFTNLSSLNDDENRYERQHWARLIETYAPLKDEETGSIIAVVEFYQKTDDLDRAIFRAQTRSWLVVVFAGLIVFAALNSMILKASKTITGQQAALEETITRQQQLLVENQVLTDRVQRAAGRTTMLNEQYLRRISSDLHDGPAQDIALALLRIGDLRTDPQALDDDERQKLVGMTESALSSALGEIRNLSSGLRIPELDAVSVEETIRLAIRDYQRKTGRDVKFTPGDLPAECSEPVRVTLFRILQESLVNSYQHAGGQDVEIEAEVLKGKLSVVISDEGKGFNPDSVGKGHLGLAGMRERAELLGGEFQVESGSGGTSICVILPVDLTRTSGEEGWDI